MPPLRPAGKTFTPSSSGETDDGSMSSSESSTAGLPKHLRAVSRTQRLWEATKSGLNFYRLHLLFFTFIVSAIFYAANGQYKIAYIDCLFCCVSAMTVTGLATVNLSTLTGFQQALLFVLMLMGSPVSVSLVMIIVRRHFFQVKFKHIIAAERDRQRQRKLSFGTWSTGGDGQSRLRRPSFLSMGGARDRFRSNGGSNSAAPGQQQQQDEKAPDAGQFGSRATTTANSSQSEGWAGTHEEDEGLVTGLWRSIKSALGSGHNGTEPTDAADRELFKSAKKARKEAERAERGRRARLEDEFGQGHIGGFGGNAAPGGRGEKTSSDRGPVGAAKRSQSTGPGGLTTSMIRRVEGEVPMLVNSAGHRGGIAVERVPTPAANTPTGEPDLSQELAPAIGSGGEPSYEEQRARRLSHQGERVVTPDEMSEVNVVSSNSSATPSSPTSRYATALAFTPQPTTTSITILPPIDGPRRGSAQTDGALSAAGTTHTQTTNGDGFHRSKTIAFDPDQVATHDHVGPGSHSVPAPTSSAAIIGHGLPRTATIEFRGKPAGTDVSGAGEGIGRRVPTSTGAAFERTNTRRSEMTSAMRSTAGASGMPPRSATVRTINGRPAPRKHSGFGGFPMPHEILRSVVKYFFPKLERKITRTVTFQRTGTLQRPGGLPVNRTATMASGRSYTGTINPAGAGAPVPVPYISFDAVVGRNSRFRDLTSEQMEELGGVEYRALKVLLVIVPCYILIMQISGWVIFWPYIDAKGRYDDVFEAQPRSVPIGWFAAFQSVSAFSNTGMSLVDMSMIPFQKAYLMIYYLMLLILAGNTAYPIFLRFIIWILSRLASERSRLHETCRFLLDHPRRCYIYLFPSHQTVFLLTVVFGMTMVDWVSFLVLDIGTPAIESLPLGDRISAGFLQSAAVRAAGFAIVPLNSLAPAVKVLYTLMMYVSVYPIAMSVRATNVYEERSLGMFEEDDADTDDGEDDYKAHIQEGKVAGWTRYLAFHARRQLAFDMWWLGLALWLICIIERGQINNPENEATFNIFNIIFELISGYGTVGLSLGVANDNYSLSGGFKVLSKLVVVAVMIRGRHRGLPVAIDRAVMLPKELLEVDADVEEELRQQHSRRSSLPLSERGRSDSRTRRDSTFSFQAPSPVTASRALRPTAPWFPANGDAGESALSDDDDPPLPPQTMRPGVSAGKHPVGAPLPPVEELPSAAISRRTSCEDLTSFRSASPRSR